MTHTEAQLAEMLRHPDAFVRSLADWALDARGRGWRHNNLPNNGIASYRIEDRLDARLEALSRNGLTSSSQFVL